MDPVAAKYIGAGLASLGMGLAAIGVGAARKPTMTDTTNIFEALRESHERQRALYSALTNTSGDTPERRDLFDQLKKELAAHAQAEDRHFYVPLMAHDAGIDLSRHAISEHHQIDEL
eukprot:gene167-245_t